MQFCHRVDFGTGQVIDHIAEQGGSTCIHCGHAQSGIVGCAGQSCAACVVDGIAIGCGNHFVVSIHNGLKLCRGIGFGTVDHGRGQRVVDGVEVGRSHATHTRIGVSVLRRHAAQGLHQTHGVELREAAQVAQSDADGVHHRLQFTQLVGLTAVGAFCSDGRQHGGQVTGGDAVQADQAQVGFCEHWRRADVGSRGLDRVGDAGQLLQFGHAVYIRRALSADDVIEQRQIDRRVGSLTNEGTDGRVLFNGGIDARRGVRGRTIGFAQDGAVGIDDGLKFGGRVGLGCANNGTVEGAVDGLQIRGRHTADADCCVLRGIGAGGRGAVTSGRRADRIDG